MTCSSGAFDALISPTDSLGSRGHRIAVALIALAGVVLALVFAGAGFALIGLMMLADALFLIAAMTGYRATLRRNERVAVRDGALLIERRDHRQTLTARHSLPLYGLHLERLEDPDYGLLALRAVRHGKAHVLGADLSPGEREAFCAALQAALRDHGLAPAVERSVALPLVATEAGA